MMQQPHGQHRFPQPGPQVRPYQQPGYPGVRIFVETPPIRFLEDRRPQYRVVCVTKLQWPLRTNDDCLNVNIHSAARLWPMPFIWWLSMLMIDMIIIWKFSWETIVYQVGHPPPPGNLSISQYGSPSNSALLVKT